MGSGSFGRQAKAVGLDGNKHTFGSGRGYVPVGCFCELIENFTGSYCCRVIYGDGIKWKVTLGILVMIDHNNWMRFKEMTYAWLCECLLYQCFGEGIDNDCDLPIGRPVLFYPIPAVDIAHVFRN